MEQKVSQIVRLFYPVPKKQKDNMKNQVLIVGTIREANHGIYLMALERYKDIFAILENYIIMPTVKPIDFSGILLSRDLRYKVIFANLVK